MRLPVVVGRGGFLGRWRQPRCRLRPQQHGRRLQRPFGAMTALSWTGTPFSIQHLSAAVLFGAVGAYLNHRKVKQVTTSSDVSMLVGIDSLKRTLPINLECMNSLDEFVND